MTMAGLSWFDVVLLTVALVGWGAALVLWRRHQALHQQARDLAADLRTREQYTKRRLADLIGRPVQANDTVGGLFATLAETAAPPVAALISRPHRASRAMPPPVRQRAVGRGSSRWSTGHMVLEPPRRSLTSGLMLVPSSAAIKPNVSPPVPMSVIAAPIPPVPSHRVPCDVSALANPALATPVVVTAMVAPPAEVDPWVAVELALARCAPVLERALAEIAQTDGRTAFDLAGTHRLLAVIGQVVAACTADRSAVAGEVVARLMHVRMLDAVDAVLRADIRLRTYASRDLSLALVTARIGALGDALRVLYAAHGYTIARPELLTQAGRLAAATVQVLYGGAVRVLSLPEAARRVARLCTGGVIEPTLAVDCDSFGLTLVRDGRLMRQTRLMVLNPAEWHRARQAVAR